MEITEKFIEQHIYEKCNEHNFQYMVGLHAIKMTRNEKSIIFNSYKEARAFFKGLEFDNGAE